MNKAHYYWNIPLTGAFLLGTAVTAAPDKYTWMDSTNRVTLSLRFGLNIHAKFSGVGNGFSSSPASGFYDNGYVVTASPPNTSPNPNFTTYWGYNSDSQLIGVPGAYTGVQFTGTTATENPSSASSGENNPDPGFELTYDRELFHKENWHGLRFGVEGAINYLKISINNNDSVGVNTSQTAYSYNFPIAIPQPPPFTDNGGPGQPALQVPGTAGAPVTGSGTLFSHDHFDANLWGGRLGPYAELPVTQKFDLRFSGGLAVGFLNADESWSQSISGGAPLTGSGSANKLLWGYYGSIDATWQVNRRWGVAGALQYQDLGQFEKNFQGRQVDLDLRRSIFVELGVSYSF
ncbi:MAG TPA: hypothetical protein VGI03_11345 [Verrucomicrobiae bacterium]|jgi:hypothetical protein